NDNKPPDQQKAGDAKKPEVRQAEEIADTARKMSGPAANFECIWLGRRVINLLSRDDLDTAFRHLDLYDRFGCPGDHIRATFRCIVRVGIPDARENNGSTLDERVRGCWTDPNMTAAASAAATPASPAPAPTAGTGAK